MAEVTALELPTFKGRPGWEFTDLSRLSLDAFSAPEGGSLDAVPEGLFSFDGTRLDQVDAAVGGQLDGRQPPGGGLPPGVERQRARGGDVSQCCLPSAAR